MGEPADAALLLVRVVVGAVMVAHGWNHWRGGGGIAGTAGWFAGLGLRRPRLQAWLSVVTETGAGLLLAAGLFTPLACAAVLSVMLVAGLLAHRPHGFFVFEEGYEYVLVLGVLAVALGAWGPGEYAVDTAADLAVTGWAGAGLVLAVAVVATGGLLAAFWRPRETT
ncbi:DoxX family protein [Streptomyces leeuwenhoekii]|uniref:DoxX family protein n=1 Tax=Streptomyces leeuwenhoekii TaxID=1437453 RepID=UPI0036FFF823